MTFYKWRNNPNQSFK